MTFLFYRVKLRLYEKGKLALCFKKLQVEFMVAPLTPLFRHLCQFYNKNCGMFLINHCSFFLFSTQLFSEDTKITFCSNSMNSTIRQNFFKLYSMCEFTWSVKLLYSDIVIFQCHNNNVTMFHYIFQ